MQLLQFLTDQAAREHLADVFVQNFVVGAQTDAVLTPVLGLASAGSNGLQVGPQRNPQLVEVLLITANRAYTLGPSTHC